MAASRRHFGNLRKLPSGRWQGSYWHAGARHLADRTFTTKADALAWLAGVEADVHRGAWADPAGGRMTVAELASCWIEANPAKRASTRTRDEAIVRLHVLPILGATKVSAVTPPAVQALVTKWCTDRTAATVRRQYAVLAAMFRYATICDWLIRTPCRGINLPAVETVEHTPVTPETVAAIAEAVEARYRPMVWLGAVLGLRWGEVAGLTVANVDTLRGILVVSHQLTRDGVLSTPKSAAGRRTLTMPVPLVDVLAAHLAAAHLTGADSGALVFTTPAGSPLNYANWRRRVWAPATRAAGIPGAGFHDLRRTSASQMVAQGVDVKVAQTRLGHSSVRLTLEVYARAVDEADRAAADRLGEAFFGTTRI